MRANSRRPRHERQRSPTAAVGEQAESTRRGCSDAATQNAAVAAAKDPVWHAEAAQHAGKRTEQQRRGPAGWSGTPRMPRQRGRLPGHSPHVGSARQQAATSRKTADSSTEELSSRGSFLHRECWARHSRAAWPSIGHAASGPEAGEVGAERAAEAVERAGRSEEQQAERDCRAGHHGGGRERHQGRREPSSAGKPAAREPFG